jgi:hypothetical protein
MRGVGYWLRDYYTLTFNPTHCARAQVLRDSTIADRETFEPVLGEILQIHRGASSVVF